MDLVLIVLTIAISAFNAVSVGAMWTESKGAGWFARAVAWSGAVMAAVGFTYISALFIIVCFSLFGLLDRHTAALAIELSYAVVLFPTLGSGLVLTVHSLIVAWRKRTFGDTAVAAWNFYAMCDNTITACDYDGSLLWESDPDVDADEDWQVALLVVLSATFAGVAITYWIVRAVNRAVIEDARRAIES